MRSSAGRPSVTKWRPTSADLRQRAAVHLELPLVLGEGARPLDVGQELAPAAGITPHQAGVLGAADALRAAAECDNGAARPHGRQAGDEALDALVEGGVQRVAAAVRQHHVGRRLDARAGAVDDEAARLRVRRLQVPREGPHHAALAVHDDVERKVGRRHAGDGQRFLVAGVASEVGVAGRRIAHERLAVEVADSAEVGHAGADGLAPAAEAGHEVRLDQPGGHAETGLDVAAVQSDAAAGPAPAGQLDQLRLVLGLVVDDAVAAGRLAEHLRVLLGAAGAVHAGGHEDQYLAARDTGGLDLREQFREEARIGHGTGDVADENHHVPRPPPGQPMLQRRRADRFPDGREHGLGSRQGGRGETGFVDDGAVRHLQRYGLASALGFDVHAGSIPESPYAARVRCVRTIGKTTCGRHRERFK